MNDDDLMKSLATVPYKCMILLENIDVAFPSKAIKRDINFTSDR